jgi:hypothetical protein
MGLSYFSLFVKVPTLFAALGWIEFKSRSASRPPQFKQAEFKVA